MTSAAQQRQQRKEEQRAREQRRTRRAERWGALRILVMEPLALVVFTTAGLLMVVGAVLDRDSGDFGFAIMVLGLGVGPLGLSIGRCLEYFEERAARRSAPTDGTGGGQKIVDGVQLVLPQEAPVAGERRRRRRRAAGRKTEDSRWLYFVLVSPLFAAACWAIGVGFMLSGYGPDHLIGGTRALPVWVIAAVVWGGLAAGGIGALVSYVRDRREK